MGTKRQAPRVTLDVVVAVLLALPTLLVCVPPMVDFAGHEVGVAVLAAWPQTSLKDAFLAGDLYQLNFGHPNQLQYLIAAPLAVLMGPTKGLEVSVALGVAGVVIGTAHLARHLGRPRWVALCAAPIAVGWNYQWGHIANLLGIAALLAAMPALDRFARAPTWRGVVASCGWMLLLYAAHETSMVVACVAVTLFAARPWSTRRALMSALPCAFAVVVVLVQLRVQEVSYATQFRLVPKPLFARVLELPAVVVGYASDADASVALFGLATLPLVVGAALQVHGRFVRSATAPTGALPDEAPRLLPYAVLAGALVVAYFALPLSYGGVFYFSHRFLPIAWCLLVVLAFGPGSEHPRTLRLGAAAVPIGVALMYFPAFLASDAVYRQLEGIASTMERRSSFASVELDQVARGAMSPAGYSTRLAQAHVVALRGGRSLHDYTHTPIALARLRSDRRWHVATSDSLLDPASLRPLVALTRFRYLILHSTTPQRLAAAKLTLDGIAHLVAATDEWAVFESDILTAKVTDPEAPYPKEASKRGPTLSELVRRGIADLPKQER